MLSYIKKLKPSTSKPATPPAAAAAQNEQQDPAGGDAVKSPVLSPSDESFLQNAMREANDGPHVVLPGSESTTGTVTPTETAAAAPAAAPAVEESSKEAKREGEWREALTARWHGLRHSVSSATERRHPKPDVKGKGKEKEEVPEEAVEAAKPKEEEEKKKKAEGEDKKKEKTEGEDKKKSKEHVREEDELTAVLEQLNLAAEDGRAFSMSTETRALLARFTQILKDVSTGVPTAYDDLTKLLDTSSSQLESTFKNLPGFLQKLIKTLPSKLEPGALQAAAAASPALATEGIVGLKELVTKPGLLMGLLKSVVNLLKTRFPALLGANAVLSMGLFVVLLVLWYCHKRGREVRLENEEKERQAAVLAPAEAEREAETAAEGSGAEGDLRAESKL